MSVSRRSFSTRQCGLRVGGHRQTPGRSSSRSPEGREDIAPSGSRIARSAARLGSCTCAGKRIGWVSRAGSPSTDTANARVCAYMESNERDRRKFRSLELFMCDVRRSAPISAIRAKQGHMWMRCSRDNRKVGMACRDGVGRRLYRALTGRACVSPK